MPEYSLDKTVAPMALIRRIPVPLFRPYRPADVTDDDEDRKVRRAVRKAVAESPAQKTKINTTTDTENSDQSDRPDELVGGGEAYDLRSREKNRPTRTRKEAEAERRAKARPNLSKKEARRKSAASRREARTAAMAARDSTPEKELLRDFFDSRWNLLEFLLPVLLVMLAGSMLGSAIPMMQTISIFVMWGFLAVAVLDFFFAWRRYKALLAIRIPGASTRGLLFYAVNRAMQIRRLRMPSARVKRGQKI